MKTLAIIGAGELGMQLAHLAIADKHYKQVVFFDDFTEEKEINGYKIIGKTEKIKEAFNNNEFSEIILGIGYKHMPARKFFFEKYKDKVPFGNIIHSTCFIDASAKYGRGIVIYPGCIIDKGVTLKDNLVINLGCVFSHDCTIESHSFFSPRVALAGFAQIDEQCIIGINTTVIDNIKIGANIQVGGGSVIIQNISRTGLYVGNPARFIR